MIPVRIVLQDNQSKETEMNIRKLVAAIVLSATLGFAAQAQDETPVEMKDLPSEAQTTIKEKAGNDQIVRIAKETRKGKECYDAIVNRNGKEMAIRVDANGKFMGTHPEKAQQKEKAEKY
jgi:NADH dehydrogenase/NADH:ubiquinone oxidoreductase subunit G